MPGSTVCTMLRDYRRLGRKREGLLHLAEGLENGDVRPSAIPSIQELFLSTAGDSDSEAEELLRWIDPRRKGGNFLLQESSVAAVKVADFSNITGQFIFSKIKEGYNYPALLWPQLCTTWRSDLLDGERVPGVGRLGDSVECVGEGEPFPYVGLNEEYLDFGPMQKRGFIVGVTREMVRMDKTGLLLERANEGGKFLSINKEKRVLDVVTGQVNNYKRNGVATNTYLLSGAYINDQSSNALVDWTSLQKAELLFDSIKDPNTGEPIILDDGNLGLLVPSALKRTAGRITRAVWTRYGDTTSSTGQQAQTPLEGGLPGEGAANIKNNYTVYSNAYVYARTSSTTKWWVGDFKKAFVYREFLAIEPMTAPENSELSFTHDIVGRYRAVEIGSAGVWEPRVVCRNEQ